MIKTISLASERADILTPLLIIIAVVMVLTIVIGLLVSFISDSVRNSVRKDNKDNVRYFTYYYGSPQRRDPDNPDSGTYDFSCFDKNDIANVKYFTAAEFYAQFSASDKYVIEEWLRTIKEGNNDTDMIQADALISSKHVYLCSMLEYDVVSYPVDTNRQVIHFTSYLLPYSFSVSVKKYRKMKEQKNNKLSLLFNSKKKMEPGAVIPLREASRFLNSAVDDYIGAVYCFKLYKQGIKDSSLSQTDRNFLASVNHDIAIRLSEFMTPYRKMLVVSPTEEIVIDTKAVSKIMAMNMAEIIQTGLQQVINEKTKGNTGNILKFKGIMLAVGVTLGSYYKQDNVLDYHLAVSQCELAANQVRESEVKKKVGYYSDLISADESANETGKNIVRAFINNSTFRIYFYPAFGLGFGNDSVDEKSGLMTPAFYYADIVPYGTGDYDFFRCVKIGMPAKYLPKLFKSIDKRIRKVAIGHQGKLQIVIRIPYESIAPVSAALKSLRETENEEEILNQPEIEYILAIGEKDIMENLKGKMKKPDKLDKIMKAGLRYALVIETSTKDLKDVVMDNATYLMVSPDFISKSKDASTARTYLRTIQLNYIMYGKPLVYFGLTSVGDVELGAHYGGTIFQCDAIAAPSSRFEELHDKKREKILHDVENLLPKTETRSVDTEETETENS